jgi:hypothetical protein
VFSSIFFPDLLAVTGDRGARGILERNAVRVGTVDFPGGELDLDTREDLERSTGLSGTAKGCTKLNVSEDEDGDEGQVLPEPRKPF